MAKKRRRRRTARSQAQEAYPGWMWMLFGLAVGLSVAFVIYMKDRGTAVAAKPLARQPASMAAPIDPDPVAAASEPAGNSEPRFSFYSMLPNFEVVVPEEEPDVRRDREAAVIQKPGTYVLQAGSFAELADADRRRAELALLGIESRVQRVTIDDRTWHRVRIGPMSNLDELNRIRSRLKQARVDVLRIRLGD